MYSIVNADKSLLFVYKQKQMEPGYKDTVHCYDELKFVRIINGSGIWNIDNKEYNVSKGDILLMSRADIRWVQRIYQAPLNIEQINFVPAFLRPIQDIAIFFVRRPKGFSNLLPKNHEISRIMDQLIEEVTHERTFKEHAIRSKLAELVIATARLLEVTPITSNLKDARQKTVEQAMTYINNHFTEPLCLEHVAQHFYLSPAYFSRLFRSHSGMNFQDYLAQVRVSQVLSIIKSQPINILDAAMQCGFSSSSGFYRTFRRITGSTPKQFK